MAMNFDKYGSYTNFQPPGGEWITENKASCEALSFSGVYADQARALCREMLKNAGSWLNGGARKVFFGTRGDFPSTAYFSLITALNNDKMYCVGSSGRKGEYPNDGAYDDPGCWGNP